ncbi:MAG TPA: hypothetical protein VGJ93_15585 [Desulfuromonadaceae bacterium]|jgi:hypothetical protein
MTDNNTINKHARAMVIDLAEYKQWEAISILATAISIIASQPRQIDDRLDSPTMAFNSGLLRRRPGKISGIEKDPEIKAFIHNLDRYYTGPDLLALLKNRFGKERTPSKSSLDRYLQRIIKTLMPNKEGNNE